MAGVCAERVCGMNTNELIVRCLRCGQKNRIPENHLNDSPRCGRCGASLDELFIQCLTCHKLNRIPEGRLYDLPLCGNCGSQLYDDYVLDVSAESFEEDVLKQSGLVLLCCYTPDCVLCRKAMPVLKKLAPRYLGNVRLVRLDIRKHAEFASRYAVERTPTYLLLRDGIHVDTIVGVTTIAEIEKKLRTIAAGPQNTL